MRSISGGYAGVPSWYPFLGPLIQRYRELAGSDGPGLAATVESAAYKVFVTDARQPDQASVEIAVQRRYGLEARETEEFARLISQARPPCMVVHHAVADALFTADYA